MAELDMAKLRALAEELGYGSPARHAGHLYPPMNDSRSP
jgi:hypothetical protein